MNETNESGFSSEDEHDADKERDLVQLAYNYLVNNKEYPADCTKNEKRTIRRKAKKFELKDGELYFKKKKKNCRKGSQKV